MNSKKELVKEIKALKKEVLKYYKNNRLEWINKEYWSIQFNEAKRLNDLRELEILKQILKLILYYYNETASLIRYYSDNDIDFDDLGSINEYFIRQGRSAMDFAALRHLASGLYDIIVSADVVSEFGYLNL